MDFLKELRKQNKLRQVAWPADFPVDEIYKSNELANEVGELCGAVKKLYRAKHNIAGNGSKTYEEVYNNFEEELGDVLICLDLLAAYFDVDLEEVTRDKFNKTSKKVNIDIFL